MALISVTINDVVQRFALTDRGISIGRQLDNDIVLNHAIVSRRHAQIVLEGRQSIVRDLNSRNGVFVNRLRIKEEQLSDGDILAIGPFELFFEDRAPQSVVFDDNQYFPIDTQGQSVRHDVLPADTINLQDFYNLGRRLNQVVDFQELLDLVVDEMLRLVPAQRAFLLLYKDKGDRRELVPMVVYPAAQGDLVISSTIVRKALENGQVMLIRDAIQDFAGAESIVSANIRSAVCAPLMLTNTTLGLLMIDSAGREQFSEHDRDRVAMVASQAAIAIERTRLTRELRQQEQLLQNLGRFLSSNVAKAVARYVSQHGKLWEAQEQVVTVLFADIKGFTALSEKLSPSEVQDLLNEYLHEMTDVIFTYNGTVDKYIGDGIMAIFGAPRLPDEPLNDDHANHAVAAALDMLEAQKRLVEKLEPSKAFDIRIGINTGVAYTGFFGTRHRLEYTVIGDTVNTASRLESQAHPGTVYISEGTKQMIGNAFVVQDIGELEVKGRTQLVHAYKVLERRT